jgi:hypothetical protein
VSGAGGPLIRILTVLCVLAAAAARPAAEACDAPECVGGFFVPERGTVPASLQNLLWIPRQADGSLEIVDSGDVELRRLDDDEGVVVPVTVWDRIAGGILIQPAWPLEAGQSYALRGRNLCEGTGAFDETATFATFDVGPPVPFPGSLGNLVVDGPSETGSLELGDGETCSVVVDAVWVDVVLDPTPEAEAWWDALLFETLVDGMPFSPDVIEPAPGESWVGRGWDRLFALCGPEMRGAPPGLPEGTHRVRLRATAADGNALIETPEIEIVLDCDAGENGAGPGDGSVDPGGVPPGSELPPDTACGCVAAGSGPPLGWICILLLLGAWTHSRRRYFLLGIRRRAG